MCWTAQQGITIDIILSCQRLSDQIMVSASDGTAHQVQQARSFDTITLVLVGKANLHVSTVEQLISAAAYDTEWALTCYTDSLA